MLPKGPRQGATLEAGGHIDDGPRSLCDVATTRGVDALVSTMPQGGLDYCTSEDGNPFPGIVINRAPYCEQTGCKKHCKEWTIVLAARMMIPMLAYIYFVCGVLGIPILIGNVGLHSLATVLESPISVLNSSASLPAGRRDRMQAFLSGALLHPRPASG